jgi:hypothetical protein
VSLVQGNVQCSGRTLASVRSQSACGLICGIYLFETVNSETTSSSNGLVQKFCILCGQCVMCCLFVTDFDRIPV